MSAGIIDPGYNEDQGERGSRAGGIVCCESRARFDLWMRSRFLRSRLTRVLAASGVGCNDFGGRTGMALVSRRASRATRAAWACSPLDFSADGLARLLGFGSLMLARL